MSSHQRVLEHMGVSDLHSLIDPAFLREHDLNQPGQYGMVCADVPDQIKQLESLGAGPFLYSLTRGPNWHEWGEPRKVMVEMSMATPITSRSSCWAQAQTPAFIWTGYPRTGPSPCITCVYIKRALRHSNDASTRLAIALR